MPEKQIILRGSAERVGVHSKESAYILHEFEGKQEKIEMDLPSYAIAYKAIDDLITKSIKNISYFQLSAVGHRYVHAGTIVKDIAKITPSLLKKLKQTFDFAPIHNPISYAVIEESMKKYLTIPQYIVVDTGFHATIPESHYTYTLPASLMKKYEIRKYGFHGTSHKYIMKEALTALNTSADNQKIVSCHLGTGGSSLCAIKNGKSIDNTMGFTPLPGLLMSTRSGDIDPIIPILLMYEKNLSLDEINNLLNKKSGLLGVAGTTSDMRDIIRLKKTNKKYQNAFQMYVNRIIEYIGAYIFLLKGMDILLFTDTLGTDIPEIREAICKNLTGFGVSINTQKNNNYKTGLSEISNPDSQVKVLVVPTNEEMMIAEDCYYTLNKEKTHACRHN